MKEISADKVCAFVCKCVFVKNFDKPLYSFDEFYFPDKTDTIEYEHEYTILAYNNNIAQCKRERDMFFKGSGANVPGLNGQNSQDPEFRTGLANLNLLDVAYLQNFRIFLKIENDNLDVGILYPHLDFTIHKANLNIKYAATALNKMLFQKGEKPLGSKAFGYFTLTHTFILHPLMHDEKNSTQFPKVGLWTFGENITEESLNNCKSTQARVWGLCTHFFKSSNITSRFTVSKDKNIFLFISFNLNSPPQIFVFKITDKSELDCETSLEHYKLNLRDAQGVAYKDSKTKVRSYNIDFSNHASEPSLHTSFEIHQNPSNFTKQSPNMNSRQDKPRSTTGIQADMKESTDSDMSIIKCLKDYQDKNEIFYRKTIERMQDQIGLLSQAIVSINQNLAILNQKVINNTSERVSDTFILPDLTTNSLSISESSNNLVFADDLKVSKTLSEVQIDSNNNKHKRYKTDDVEIIRQKDLDNHKRKSFDDQLIQDNKEKTKNQDSVIFNESNFRYTMRSKKESLTPDDDIIENSIVQSLNKMNSEIEYRPTNENTNSIPIPKINPKFKRYIPSSDSDSSEHENDKSYKNVKQKYSK